MPEYYCQKCDYLTENKSHYSKHLKTGIHKNGTRKIRSDKGKEHNITKVDYKCGKCKYQTKNKYNFLEHYLRYHATPKERAKKYDYYCKLCDYGSLSYKRYQCHLKGKKHRWLN